MHTRVRTDLKTGRKQRGHVATKRQTGGGTASEARWVENKGDEETDLPLFWIEQQQLGRLVFVADTVIVFAVQPVRTACVAPQSVLLDQFVVRIKGEISERAAHVCKVGGSGGDEFALDDS